MEDSIVGSVLNHAESAPDKPAVIAKGKIVSYEKLWDYVLSVASWLSNKGIRTNDRVVLSASASPYFIYGYLATHLIGAIAVLVDPQSPESRFNYIIDKAQPKIAFTSIKSANNSVLIFPMDELKRIDPNSGPFNFPKQDQVADILFTTGTTGDPKGVVLTHKNINSAVKNINAFIGNTSEDSEVIPLPLSHSFGLGRMRCNLKSGGTLILVDGFTFIGNIFKALDEWNATGLSAVPAGFAVLFRTTKDKIGEYANQLKYIEIGSSPMPITHKQRLKELLPKTRICMHYGLTEASRSSFIEFHESGVKFESSIGKAAPNVDIKISDGKNKELPPRQIGKIMVKGAMVMKEYLNDKELTNNTLKSDWLDTGDFGYKDEGGFLYLEAREKEMINVGGQKVSPTEIERLLKKHKSVKNCACVGIPDPKGILGEVVKAFLVIKEDQPDMPEEEELVDMLKGKLEPYKIPIEFEWIDALPKTYSGKIKRISLKQRVT